MKSFRSNVEHAKHAEVETVVSIQLFSGVGVEASRSPGVAPIVAVGEMITTPSKLGVLGVLI